MISIDTRTINHNNGLPCISTNDCFVSFQVLGYRVVASSSTAVKQDYNEYMWTMRKLISEPEQTAFDTASTVDRDNLANSGREALANNQLHHSQVDLPDE